MASAVSSPTSKHGNGEAFAWPTLDAIEENMRKARRAYIEGRHATEDIVAGAALKVRRHPLTAVGIAAGTGLLVGGIFGLFAGRCARR